MATELEKLQADLAFLQEVTPLIEEFEAARANKAVDPQAWADIKQVFEEKRTYWRLIGEYLNAEAVQSATGDTNITASAIVVVTDVASATPLAPPQGA